MVGIYSEHRHYLIIFNISTEKCLCWETVNDKIEIFKSNHFIQQGNETKNCIQAIAHSAPLIKTIQLNCTNTVIGKKRFQQLKGSIYIDCRM